MHDKIYDVGWAVRVEYLVSNRMLSFRENGGLLDIKTKKADSHLAIDNWEILETIYIMLYEIELVKFNECHLGKYYICVHICTALAKSTRRNRCVGILLHK